MRNIENARMLVHFSVIQANLVGAPKCKALTGRGSSTAENNSTSSSSSTSGVTGNTADLQTGVTTRNIQGVCA